MDQETLIKLACVVRSTVKEWVVDNNAIDPETLNGACAIASNALWEILRALNYNTRLVVRCNEDYGGHCWIEDPNTNMVIDVTATQFDGPEIAYYNMFETPDWFPDFLELDYYDGDSPACFECYNEDAHAEVSTWLKQSPLTYSKETDNLIKVVLEQYRKEN